MRTDVALAWLYKHGSCRAKNIEQRDAFDGLVHCGHATALTEHVHGVKNVRGSPGLDTVYHLTETGRAIAVKDD